MPNFDPQAYLAAMDNDGDLVVELLQAFIEDAPVRMAALEQAAVAGDMEAAVRAAHSLKGMCGVLRTEGLVAQSLALELAARQGDAAALQTGVTLLRRHLDGVIQASRAFLDSPRP